MRHFQLDVFLKIITDPGYPSGGWQWEPGICCETKALVIRRPLSSFVMLRRREAFWPLGSWNSVGGQVVFVFEGPRMEYLPIFTIDLWQNAGSYILHEPPAAVPNHCSSGQWFQIEYWVLPTLLGHWPTCWVIDQKQVVFFRWWFQRYLISFNRDWGNDPFWQTRGICFSTWSGKTPCVNY